jgi:hypothetical protein
LSYHPLIVALPVLVAPSFAWMFARCY